DPNAGAGDRAERWRVLRPVPGLAGDSPNPGAGIHDLAFPRSGGSFLAASCLPKAASDARLPKRSDLPGADGSTPGREGEGQRPRACDRNPRRGSHWPARDLSTVDGGGVESVLQPGTWRVGTAYHALTQYHFGSRARRATLANR